MSSMTLTLTVRSYPVLCVVGRPRRRAREAVLFKSEEETQNCQRCGEHFATLSALRSHKMKVHSKCV